MAIEIADKLFDIADELDFIGISILDIDEPSAAFGRNQNVIFGLL